MFTGKVANLHATGIVLGLRHPDVKSSLLISSSGRCNCSTGLLVGAVDGELIKCNLRLGSREEMMASPSSQECSKPERKGITIAR